MRVRPSPTENGIMVFSQIQVIDVNGNNIALGKPTYSTSYTLATSDIAVDGTSRTRSGDANLFMTRGGTQYQEYWQVDLEKNMQIGAIVFIGRGDIINSGAEGMFIDIIQDGSYVPSITKRLLNKNEIQVTTYENDISLLPATSQSATSGLNAIAINNIGFPIVGFAPPKAVQDMQASLDLCKIVELGDIEKIQDMVNISYKQATWLQPFIRINITTKCKQEVIQEYSTEEADFKTIFSQQNQASNDTQCNRALTGDMLALIPFYSRNFLINWIFNRSKRLIDFAASTSSAGSSTFPVQLTVPTYGLNISSPSLLNSIAQQFYEFLGGNYTMTYIYDILQIGTNIIDMRFDVTVYNDDNSSNILIDALKQQYKSIIDSNYVTQGNLDTAKNNYQERLSSLEGSKSADTSAPFVGVVGRMFYTLNSTTGAITITGMTLDNRAVTSFITDLNGGISAQVGGGDGNVNFITKTKYVLNPTENFNCFDEATLKRMMSDYIDTVNADNTILQNSTYYCPPGTYPNSSCPAQNPLDTSSGILMVNSIKGVTQVSPRQCAVHWSETLYSSVTNLPASSNYPIDRYGLISYSKDNIEWNVSELTFDISGLKFYRSPTIAPCVFNPTLYAISKPSLSELNPASPYDVRSIQTHYIQNYFTNGNTEVCPDILPTYTFNAADYAAVGYTTAPGDTRGYTLATAMNEYATSKIFSNLPVKSGFTISVLPSPIVFPKPMPAESVLDNYNGNCPTNSCDSVDVLFTLADQYNSDPTKPGTIALITRSFTPNPSQCDVEVELNYDSMISHPIITKNQIKKGTVSLSTGANGSLQADSVLQPLTGLTKTTLAMYVSRDKNNCDYILLDVSGVNSGTSIQPNTPQLYEPMVYSIKLAERVDMGSAVSKIRRDFSPIAGSAKSVLRNYRLQTYAAVGDLTTLAKCPTTSCSNSTIMNSLMSFYQQKTGTTISTILNVGTLNETTCDISFTTSTNQTLGARFTMTPGAGPCTFTPTAYSSILPSPSYDDLLAMGSTTAPTSAVASSTGSTAGFVNYVNPVNGFTDYSPTTVDPYPISKRGFGLDRARNSDPPIKDKQFVVPLEQEVLVPESADETPVTAYKFLRFRPLKTRNPTNPSVHVSKFTFFLDDKAISLVKGKVSNPMGTWEGSITDVTGAGFKSGWSDDHKSPLLFAFPDAIAVNGYSFTTTIPENGLQGDPISWKLEGSLNSTYWTTLDVQTNFPTPVERFKEIAVISF